MTQTATTILALSLVLSVPAFGGSIEFTHGVASGGVTPHGAILWTRTSDAAEIQLEVANDLAFQDIVRTSSVTTEASRDFTAKAAVRRLTPGQTYYYRWLTKGNVSDTGSFRTAPNPADQADVRFVITGDSDGTNVGGAPFYNQFEVLDAARAENADFFVYLGDTIYSDSGLRPDGPAITVDEYHEAYRVNREIQALPDILKSMSTYAMWDDHEVQNDFDGETVDPDRYAAGRQAFQDYMPMRLFRLPADPGCAGPPMMRWYKWGKDVEIYIPDQRSCRSADVNAICEGDLGPTLPGGIRQLFADFVPPLPPEGCLDAMFDPDRTMLGPSQKALLKGLLIRSTAKFKLIINEVPIQQFFALPYDRWEGYSAERNEILNFIRDNAIENVVFLTTDMHANLVSDVVIDKFDDPEPIAIEIVTGPIATNTYEQEIIDFAGPDAVIAFDIVLAIAGAGCQNLDTDAYGLVEYSPKSGLLNITLKDDNGNEVLSEFAGTSCAISLGGD